MWDDPVKCRIMPRQVEDGDEYVSFSYVCGSAENLMTIEVNSHEFTVTRNLHSAMRRLRWHGYSGALWIDSLCINQADSEKSVQVTKMAETYKTAPRVFVWLETFDNVADCNTAALMATLLATFFRNLASNTHVQEAIDMALSRLAQDFNKESERL